MIRLAGVTCRFPASAQPVLEDASLHVRRGGCTVLLGRSGGGKSTVLKLVSGVVPAIVTAGVAGSVRVAGRDVAGRPLHDVGRGVGTVFQDCRSQFFMTHVAEELVFAAGNFGLPQDVIRDRLQRAVTLMDLGGLLHKSVFRLSSGQRQRVAIASVAVHGPEVVLLDEPSSNLDAAGLVRLGVLLRTLREEGATILVADHRTNYLRDVADGAACVANGRIRPVEDLAGALGERADVAVGAGLSGGAWSGAAALASPRAPGMSGSPPLLELRKVSLRLRGTRVIDAADCTLHAGEVVALTGDNGAGKTTLLRALCGLLRPASGNILINGARAGSRERRRRCAVVMQDPDYQLFTESVAHELRLGNEGLPDLDARVAAQAGRFGLSGLLDRHPGALSMGEKQRTLIAAVLMAGRDIVLLDEPTSGMDHARMLQLADVVRELAGQGKLVFVVTHDADFVQQACTRTLCLRGGRILSREVDGVPLGKALRQTVVPGVACGDCNNDALRFPNNNDACDVLNHDNAYRAPNHDDAYRVLNHDGTFRAWPTRKEVLP
ncbi:ABC transporter ATP-binding protein [Nitratidesulfovibrio sp.]|uniref:ABC transporter ATP-binding protein n=1 Tax=Nitratidesulfovibrio sp. TaxID=2802297 RepID=UPI00333F969E